MNGQRIGYKRVSSAYQNDSRQLEGIENLDRVFTDHVSGSTTDRNGYQEMMKFVRAGDQVFVHSMDRLARNLGDLKNIVKLFVDQKIQITFVKEALTFDGADSPMSNLLLNLVGAFSEFEREIIKERQREGIALAKKRGAYKGRKKTLNTFQVSELLKRIEGHENKTALAKEFGISRQTLYSYMNNKVK